MVISEDTWISYHENGRVNVRTKIRNGISHGLHEVYYRSGRLMVRGYYESGRMHGQWEYYYSNGQLELKENYSNGNWKGTIEEYLENGAPLGKIPARLHFKKAKTGSIGSSRQKLQTEVGQ